MHLLIFFSDTFQLNRKKMLGIVSYDITFLLSVSQQCFIKISPSLSHPEFLVIDQFRTACRRPSTFLVVTCETETADNDSHCHAKI